MISDTFHLMAKPTGPICNLDCKYCFYLDKENLYPGNKKWAMTDEVLERFVKEYIITQRTSNINFAWQGGEPTLLGVNFFKKVVKLQKKYSSGKSIINAFQTNGMLLNDEWCEFFVKNNFLVGLSVDGPKELHDKFRVYKGGQATFDGVMRGLSFLKKHSVEFNTLTCVTRENSYKPLGVYSFLKEIGSSFMQFIPVVERKLDCSIEKSTFIPPESDSKPEVTKWSVESLQYGKFLATIFDEWVQNDVGKYFIQIFDVSLESWLGLHQSLCIFSETCGHAMAIEHNGDIYSCDHYVYPENKLGNIMEKDLGKIVNGTKQVKFGIAKKYNLPKYCLDCEVRFACNGECPKHRFIKTPSGEKGLNYLCAGYKYFFNHIDIYMKFMANELVHQRPPANVMSWVQKNIG